jgi:SET domain-containing protein
MPNPELPKIVRRRSSLHGYGVFAVEPINKNKRIIDYAGELIRNGKACHRREAKYLKDGCLWVFRVNRAWSRDAFVGGNIARFINHSCRPNCYVHILGGVIWIRAARTIRSGEELTYHYNTDGEGLIKCRCRPGCQHLL